jgi:hypothetical protein
MFSTVQFRIVCLSFSSLETKIKTWKTIFLLALYLSHYSRYRLITAYFEVDDDGDMVKGKN